MSAFDDSWNALNHAIGVTLTARNKLDRQTEYSQWHELDSHLTQLINRRETLAETQYNKILNDLTDEGELQKLAEITGRLRQLSEKISAAVDVVNNGLEVVKVANSLLAFVVTLA